MIEIFSKKYILRFFIVTVILIAQQACGIDAILMYSNNIFLDNITDKKLATIYTNLIGLTQVISALCVIFIIERLGRRTLLIIGLAFITISLYSIAGMYYINVFDPVVYLILFFIFCNGMSLSPLSYVYAADLLPENGVGIGMMFNFLTSFLVSQSFLYLKDSFLGIAGTITIYATWTFVTFIISIFYVKETRGLSAT